MSIFAKRGDTAYITILLSDDVGLNDEALINLDDGTISIVSDTVYSTTFKTKEFANGWYRIEASHTSSTNPAMNMYIAPNIFGANLNNYCYIIGMQYENLPFATSYIPTTTIATTRAKDILYVDYMGNIAAPNMDEFTCIVDVSLLGKTGSAQQVFQPTEDGRLLLFNGDNVRYAYYANIYNTTSPIDAEDNTVRVAITRDSNNVCNFYMDGVLYGTAPGGTILTPTYSKIYIGCDQAENSQLCGHISNFRMYDRALNALEISMA
jgi:hypothetical protein